jgi:hypothetical protein
MPHATTVVKLAMALQVSTDWLLGLSESTVPTDDGGAWEVAVQLSPSNRAWWVGLGKTLITEQHLMEENVRRWRQQV